MINISENIELADNCIKTLNEVISKLDLLDNHNVLSEEGRDIKLELDKVLENNILTFLESNSDLPIISEEKSPEVNFLDYDKVWIIDPLDGSLNFSRQIPMYCVSISMWSKGEPQIGIVYDLYHNIVYRGNSLEGFSVNGHKKEIEVFKVIEQAVIATGFPTLSSFKDSHLRKFIEQIQKFKKVRLFGSAALSLAYVASNIVDAYYENGIRIWDVAAGLALVKFAGGEYSLTNTKMINSVVVKAASSSGLLNSI